MISFIHCGVFLAILNVYSGQRTQEIYRSALFARPETVQRADELYRKVSQNVTTPMDKTVEHILQWLQSRFDQKNRNTRDEDGKEYTRNPNYTLKPQPFALTKSYDGNSNNGYPAYQTYPTPSFYPYAQNPYPTTVAPAALPISPLNTSDSQLRYSPPAESTSESNTDLNTDLNSNPNIENTSYPSILDEFTTLISTMNDSFTKSEDNSANELESSMANHLPHIHSVDVQCSKDKMVINIEFNDIFNGIIYSKGYYNDPNCQYVTKNSGQNKYSFIVQLNSCGTQFVDEFYKNKQAFLENVLVLQNEPGIQEVWDTVRSVRCLWEGNIKQTLSAGLNVETLNQDILTFSGDMIAARLEIQVGKGPNAPAANGLVKIGETMTLVVTVDGDSAFDILVRSCTATDGNPNSGNLIELTDDQGCILKPKLFGNFQMIKNPDMNKPSVVAYAYFQAFKFPDVMDLLIECNVELCKSQCQSCTRQTEEPVRQKRLVDDGNLYLVNSTKILSEKLHVFTPDDIKLVAASLSNYYNDENQVCFSTTTLYLQNTITIMFFFTSCVIITCFWLKLKKLTEKTIFY